MTLPPLRSRAHGAPAGLRKAMLDTITSTRITDRTYSKYFVKILVFSVLLLSTSFFLSSEFLLFFLSPSASPASRSSIILVNLPLNFISLAFFHYSQFSLSKLSAFFIFLVSLFLLFHIFLFLVLLVFHSRNFFYLLTEHNILVWKKTHSVLKIKLYETLLTSTKTYTDLPEV